MTTQKSPLPDRVSAWLQRWLLKTRLPAGVSVEPLAGDGSTRSFFRVHIPPPADRNYVLLVDPDWIFSKDYPAHQAYLKTKQIPVPEFLDHDSKAGCLLMEDKGDELLQNRLLADPSKKLDWLSRATELLADLHGRTYPVPTDLPVSTRRFDAKKYGEELNFTLEHLSVKLLNEPPAKAPEQEILARYAKTLEKIPPDVFAHRDYHCRNLLVENERLAMIDFQDARLGPPHYDLASLVFDPYVPTTAAERETLVRVYRERCASYPLHQAIRWQDFDETLRFVGYQRLVKAAGSFASFFTRYGKKTHLPYLIPALKTAQALWEATPSLPRDLARVFALTEWQRKAQGLSL